MNKRLIKEEEMGFLKRELGFLVKSEILPAEKAQEIQGLYQVKEKLSFTNTLLYVGAILIGAGILSFIASNWAYIGKTMKFLLIIGMLIGCYAAGFKLERNYPKTSKSFYYMGVLVYGAGIFLVGQMFNFGGSFQEAFLWWSLGILPLAWVLRDKWILFAASLFVFIYLTNTPFLQGETIPYWILLWIAVIFYLNGKMGFSRAIGFVSGLHLLIFIGIIMSFFMYGRNEYPYVYWLVYLIIGVFLVLMNRKIKGVYVLLGHLVHGIAALILSFKDTWTMDWMYIPFSLLYIFFVLSLIKRGSLLNIIILCVMILRFYLDLSLMFLPKSFVFILGGCILLGFGFYFEKQRKKGVGIYD